MNGKNGSLPLHEACTSRQLSLNAIQYLVEQYPAGLQVKNNDGSLPLHRACFMRAPPDRESVRFLLTEQLRLDRGTLIKNEVDFTFSQEAMMQLVEVMTEHRATVKHLCLENDEFTRETCILY